MCGIVGLINNWKTGGLTNVQQRLFHQMLYVDALRGMDATGVIAVQSNKDFSIMKEAQDSYIFNYSFIDSDVDKQLFKTGVAVIGHNRAKTVGENKDENAHPFVVDNTFAMVHNGTLRNHKQLADKDVDSHALTEVLKAAMDEEDWKPALEKALSKVEGAYACVWYDQKRHQICMVRNSERPLGIVVTDQEVLFGSEASMLVWIASRNSRTIKDTKILSTNTLYTFDCQKTGGEFSETNLSLTLPLKPIRGFTNGTAVGTTSTKKEGNASSNTKSENERWQQSSDVSTVSKNLFKRLSSTLAGKRLDFYMEDFFDTNANPNPTEDADHVHVLGYSLNGAYDLCDVRHCIRGMFSLKDADLTEKQFAKVGEMGGIVSHCEYDKANKQIIIHMKSLKIKAKQHEVLH